MQTPNSLVMFLLEQFKDSGFAIRLTGKLSPIKSIILTYGSIKSIQWNFTSLVRTSTVSFKLKQLLY